MSQRSLIRGQGLWVRGQKIWKRVVPTTFHPLSPGNMCGRSFECLTSFVTIVALWRSIVLSFESLKKLCSKNPFKIESKFSIRKIFDLIQNTCNFLAYKRLGIYSTNCQNLRLILHKFWRFSCCPHIFQSSGNSFLCFPWA